MNRTLKAIAVCLSVPAIFFLHARHLKFWFDETVQLSSAHSSHPERLDPFRYKVDPATAVSYNQRYNMDPGGYTLYLNLMGPLVQNRFHIHRFVNISAFILGLALVIRKFSNRREGVMPVIDALTWSTVYLISLAAILHETPWGTAREWLPLASLQRSGFSIRAYGFEFLAVSALLYAADWHRTYSVRSFIAMASIMSFGLTLRYDYALFVFAFLAALSFDAYRKGDLKRLLSFPPTWIVLSTVSLVLLLIFRFGYLPQMGGMKGPMKMGYLASAYLNKGSSVAEALSDPLNIVALALFLYSTWRVLTARNTFLEMLYSVLFLTYLGLSLKGFYPFRIGLDRCLAIDVVFSILFVRKTIDALTSLFARIRPVEASFKLSRRGFVTTLALLTSLFSLGVVWVSVQRQGSKPFMAAMTSRSDSCFDGTISGLSGASVFIDRAATPNIKAFYEFRGRSMPANEYVCDSAGPHSRQINPPTIEERMAKALERPFDFYVVPQLFGNEKMKAFLGGPGYEQVPCATIPDEKNQRQRSAFNGRYSFYRRSRNSIDSGTVR